MAFSVSLIHNPLAVYIFVLVVSSAIRALPEPKTTSSAFYLWFYAFTHALGANWDKVQAASDEAATRFKKQNPL